MVHLLPGFASKDPTMRAATASAFVVFLRLWGTSIVNENLQKLFKIAMLLVYDKNKCVFRATLKLFRVRSVKHLHFFYFNNFSVYYVFYLNQYLLTSLMK
jgi:hypothetical protein